MGVVLFRNEKEMQATFWKPIVLGDSIISFF